jgi:hypothetical protein
MFCCEIALLNRTKLDRDSCEKVIQTCTDDVDPPQVKGPVGAKMGELTKYFTKSYQESEIEVLQYLLYSIIVI